MMPPLPGMDPRRGNPAPSITPTSTDPNDRAPENTAAREAESGMLGMSDDFWQTIMEAGLATMMAGEEGMSTLGAIGTGGMQALMSQRERQRAEAEEARQTELEDRAYGLDKMMAGLQAEEARRPQYQMVTDASGNLVAVDTRDPSRTVPTGVRQRVPGSGGGGISNAQRLQMISAASDLQAAAYEAGEEITFDEALARVSEIMGVGGTNGGGAAPYTPTDEDISMLEADPSPEMRAYFDEAFGPGAAAQVLGQ